VWITNETCRAIDETQKIKSEMKAARSERIQDVNQYKDKYCDVKEGLELTRET
jgi:hypothetical protein